MVLHYNFTKCLPHLLNKANNIVYGIKILCIEYFTISISVFFLSLQQVYENRRILFLINDLALQAGNGISIYIKNI